MFNKVMLALNLEARILKDPRAHKNILHSAAIFSHFQLISGLFLESPRRRHSAENQGLVSLKLKDEPISKFTEKIYF